MTDHKISITFTTNASGVAAQLKDIAAAARAGAKAMGDSAGGSKAASAGLKDVTGSAAVSGKALNDTASSASVSGKALADAGGSAKTSASGLASVGSASQTASAGLADAGSSAGQSAKALGSVGAESRTVSGSLNQVDTAASVTGRSLGDVSTNAGSAGRSLSDVGDSASVTGAGLRDVGSGASSTGAGLREVGSSGGGAATALKATGDSASLTGRALGFMTDVGKEAISTFAGFVGAQAVIAGIQKSFQFVTDTVIGFDKAMTESTAIMGDISDAQKQAMGNTAIDTAVKYGIAVDKVAQSYYFLVSAGYDAAQSQQAIGQVAAFASAGMFDLETATELAADAQNAMGLKSGDAAENLKQLTRITDVLVKANIDANGSTEDFASALTNKAATAAKTFGVSLEDTVAVLEVFASKGLKGLKAGEAFSIVMRDLDVQWGKSKDAFKGMGVTVYDAQGAFAGFPTIVRQLEAGLKGLNVEQQNARLSSLGLGAEAASFLKLLAGGADDIEHFANGLKDSMGYAAEIAGKQLESISGKLDQLRSAAQKLGLEGFVKLGEAAQWLGDRFGPTFANIVTAGGKVGAVLVPIGQAIAGLTATAAVKGLEGLASVLGTLSGAIANNDLAIHALAIGTLALLASQAITAAKALGVLAYVHVGDGLIALVGAATDARIALKGLVDGYSVLGGAANVAKAGISNVTSALTSNAGQLVLTGALLYQTARSFQAADDAAKNMVDTLTKNVDTKNVKSMQDAVAVLQKQIEEADREIQGTNFFKQWGVQVADFVTGGNLITTSADDWASKVEAAGDKQDEFAGKSEKTTAALYEMAHGFTDLDEKAKQTPKNLMVINDQTQKLADSKAAAAVSGIAGELDRIAKLKGWDASTKEGAESIRQFYEAAHKTAPAAELATALEVMGDSAKQSKEKVDAFKTSLDNLFGVAINVNSAQTKVATGFLELSKAAIAAKAANVAGADAFDLQGAAAKRNLEAVAANRDAINTQAQNILGMAEAYRSSGRSAIDAASDMMVQRDQLLQSTMAFGLTRVQAEAYLATLNLTPENIRTIAVFDPNDASNAADRLTKMFEKAALPRTAVIGLDGMKAITAGDTLAKILDDNTKERVAKINANAKPAEQVTQYIGTFMDKMTGAERTALLGANDRVARGVGSELDKFLVYIMQTRMAELRADGGQAKTEAGAVKTAVESIPTNRNVTITATVIDRATTTLDALARRAAVSPSYPGAAADGWINYHQYVDGGLRTAAAYANGTENHVAQIAPAGSWRVWAEPETEGEAYIPLAASKRARSLNILEATAQHFGMQVVPVKAYAAGGIVAPYVQAPSGGWSGGNTRVTIGTGAVQVTVRADAGVDRGAFTEAVARAVEPALAGFASKLTNELRTRGR